MWFVPRTRIDNISSSSKHWLEPTPSSCPQAGNTWHMVTRLFLCPIWLYAGSRGHHLSGQFAQPVCEACEEGLLCSTFHLWAGQQPPHTAEEWRQGDCSKVSYISFRIDSMRIDETFKRAFVYICGKNTTTLNAHQLNQCNKNLFQVKLNQESRWLNNPDLSKMPKHCS